jgi:hypothetical protein
LAVTGTRCSKEEVGDSLTICSARLGINSAPPGAGWAPAAYLAIRLAECLVGIGLAGSRLEGRIASFGGAGAAFDSAFIRFMPPTRPFVTITAPFVVRLASFAGAAVSPASATVSRARARPSRDLCTISRDGCTLRVVSRAASVARHTLPRVRAAVPRVRRDAWSAAGRACPARALDSLAPLAMRRAAGTRSFKSTSAPIDRVLASLDAGFASIFRVIVRLERDPRSPGGRFHQRTANRQREGVHRTRIDFTAYMSSRAERGIFSADTEAWPARSLAPLGMTGFPGMTDSRYCNALLANDKTRGND